MVDSYSFQPHAHGNLRESLESAQTKDFTSYAQMMRAWYRDNKKYLGLQTQNKASFGTNRNVLYPECYGEEDIMKALLPGGKFDDLRCLQELICAKGIVFINPKKEKRHILTLDQVSKAAYMLTQTAELPLYISLIEVIPWPYLTESCNLGSIANIVADLFKKGYTAHQTQYSYRFFLNAFCASNYQQYSMIAKSLKKVLLLHEHLREGTSTTAYQEQFLRYFMQLLMSCCVQEADNVPEKIGVRFAFSAYRMMLNSVLIWKPLVIDTKLAQHQTFLLSTDAPGKPHLFYVLHVKADDSYTVTLIDVKNEAVETSWLICGKNELLEFLHSLNGNQTDCSPALYARAPVQLYELFSLK